MVYDQEYKYPKFTELKKVSEKELQKYEGTYYSKDLKVDFKIFIKDENLFAQLADQPSFPLEYAEEDKFKNDNIGVEIAFAPEKKQLTLIQNGNTLVFDKK